MRTQTLAKPAGFLGALSSAWTRYRKRRAAIAELQALGGAELDRLVQDAGLTFSDLVALAKLDNDAASLLYRRLEEAGIDVKSIDLAVLRDMQRSCSFCDSKALCEHELDDHPKAASWPKYCPNRETLAALSAMKCCH